MAEDQRICFLQYVTLKTLKLKPDKWQKFIGAEETQTTIITFFEKTDIEELVISLNAASQLEVHLGFPQTVKTKAVYFVKHDNVKITKDNLKQIYIGDVANSPVEATIGVMEEVSVNMTLSKFSTD